MISENYDSLVDVERNCHNISNLIGFLSERIDINKTATVMDYGCGTGLSVRALPNPGLRIIGFDRCSKMRMIAASRGLEVWSPDELVLQPTDFFAGAFASYVLHLHPHTLELELLWARLRSDGIFVANFHKNRGIEFANVLMRGLGATVKVLESPADSEIHGTYVAYLKR
jgi:trans-aconitate methyltransferase